MNCCSGHCTAIIHNHHQITVPWEAFGMEQTAQMLMADCRALFLSSISSRNPQVLAGNKTMSINISEFQFDHG
jgi:hypothetical protein